MCSSDYSHPVHWGVVRQQLECTTHFRIRRRRFMAASVMTGPQSPSPAGGKARRAKPDQVLNLIVFGCRGAAKRADPSL